MYFIWYIIIGIVAGLIAGKIMKGGGFGVLVNLLVGITGGVLGGWGIQPAGCQHNWTSGKPVHLSHRSNLIVVDHIFYPPS